MYHEITRRDRTHRRRRLVVVLLVCALVIGVLAAAINVARINSREQGATALRQSILSAAVRCCAVEGSYPMSLDKLEEDYGLRINHRDYIITYEAYASNIAPSVVVIPR